MFWPSGLPGIPPLEGQIEYHRALTRLSGPKFLASFPNGWLCQRDGGPSWRDILILGYVVPQQRCHKQIDTKSCIAGWP